MSSYLCILLLLSHFLGDWIFQSREIAENKSKKLYVLFVHLLYVHLTLFPICFYILNYNISNTLFLLSINLVLHGLIDWNIWKLYPRIIKTSFQKKYTEEDVVNLKLEEFMKYNLYAKNYMFYTFIAIDQFLHLSILFYLFRR